MIELIIALTVFLFLFIWFANKLAIKDSREIYYRQYGQVVALKIEGIQGELPDHEDLMHDDLPHQNPLVEIQSKFSLWYGFHSRETRFYPITINDETDVDIVVQRLTMQVEELGDERMSVILLNDQQEKGVYRVESDEQRARGVEKLKRQKDT